MTKEELKGLTKASKDETREALQILFDALNQGQQNKVLKDEKVKALLNLYGVDYS